MSYGDIEDHGQLELRSRTKQIAALHFSATKFITPQAKRFWLHSMPGRAKKSGRRLSLTINPDITSPWLRWSQEAK